MVHNRHLRAAVAGLVLAASLTAAGAHAHGLVHARIQALSGQIAKQSRDGSLYVKRARLWLDEAHYHRAVRDLRKALSVDPTLHAAWYFLGKAEFLLGRLARAQAAAERFVERLSDDNTGGQARGHLLLGQVLARRGQAGAAVRHLGRSIAVSRQPRPQHALELCELLVQLDRAAEAVQMLDGVAARIGDAATLQQRAAQLEAKLGKPEAALRRVEALIKASPMPASWLLEKARLLRTMQRPAEARLAAAQGLHALHRLPPERRRSSAVRQQESALQALARWATDT